MPVSEDTEITLGTGKLLAVFFGLVLVCAVFFGMGFSLGRAAVKPAATGDIPVSTSEAVVSASAQNTIPPASTGTDLSFYKSVQSKAADPQLVPPTNQDEQKETATGNPDTKSEPKTETAKAAQEVPHREAPVAAKRAGYYVQIAAVSKEEDAKALVEALLRKQYAAFSTTTPADQFFHVQIGPFAEIKDAESMRTRLVGAGYSPIVKR
jgi:cell division septation protein DedD